MEQKYTPEEIERLMESIDRRLDFILKALDKEEKEKKEEWERKTHTSTS